MADVIPDLKFYDDGKMQGAREALEREALAWPGVARKGMMGCLVYFRGKKFFAFLVTGGLVITKLPEADRAALGKRPGAKPFEMSGRTAGKVGPAPRRETHGREGPPAVREEELRRVQMRILPNMTYRVNLRRSHISPLWQYGYQPGRWITPYWNP